jgi:hypothetical protein
MADETKVNASAQDQPTPHETEDFEPTLEESILASGGHIQKPAWEPEGDK